MHLYTTAMQVPSAHPIATTTVGVSSQQATATDALPSKALEQRAEVFKAQEHKVRGFPSQAGHKKASKAMPLQLMLYQWGLPQKVVQVICMSTFQAQIAANAVLQAAMAVCQL